MRPLLLTAFLLAPALASAQTAEEERDRGLLTRLIEDNLSTVSRTVIIDGFRGALSSRATVERLTIADADGVWLIAEDLVLEWNRAAVFRGRIEIAELGAGRISLLRPPEAEAPPPSPEATPFALPELPVSIEIGSLRATEIVLGAPLLGSEMTVTLDGSVNLAGGEGNAVLSADRLDGEGQFEIAGSYSNTTRILDLDIALSEAPDGIVAGLIGLPGTPALDLALVGTGPLDDYTADLTLATDGIPRVTGSFGLETVPGPEDGAPGQLMRIDIAGDVASLVPSDYADFFGTESRLVARAQRDGDGTLRIPALSVSTRTLDLRGEAVFGSDGWPRLLSLVGNLEAEDGSPILLPRAGERTFARTARLALVFNDRAGDGWTLDFTARDITRPGLSLETLTLAGGGTIRRAEAGGVGVVTGDLGYGVQGLAPEDPGLAIALGPEIAGRLRFERDGPGPLHVRALTLEGPGVTLDAAGTVGAPADGFPIALTAVLDAADLGRFAPLAGLPLGGGATLDLDAAYTPFSGLAALRATGATRDLRLGIDVLDPLLGGDGSLTLSAARDEEGTRLDQFDIATVAVTLAASADLRSAGSTARLSFAIDDLGRVLDDLAGPASLGASLDLDDAGTALIAADLVLPNGTARIEAQRPRDGDIAGTARIRIADLAPYGAFAGRPLAGVLAAEAQGVLASDAGTFDATFSTTTSDLALGDPRLDPLVAGEIAATARVIRLGPQTFRIAGLDLSAPALTAAGDLTLDGDALATPGLSLAAPDLAAFAGLAGRPLAGAVNLAAAGTLGLDLSTADITLSAGTTDVVTGDPRIDPLLNGTASLFGTLSRTGPETLTVESLVLTSPILSASGSATLAEGQITTPGITVAAADLAPFSALAGRPVAGALRIEAAGGIALDLSTADVTLSARTADISVGIAQIDPLLAGEGQLDATIVRTDADNLRIDRLTLSTPALALTARGEVTEGTGTVGFDLGLTEAAFLAPGVAGNARLSGTLDFDAAGVITADLDASGPGGLALDLAATARPVAGTPGVYAVESTGDLALDSLASYSTLAGRPLSGSLNLALGGTIRTDLAAFDMTLDGRARSPGFGEPTVARLLAGEGTFGGRLIRNGGGGLTVEGLSLAFPNITASGALTARGSTGTAGFDARLTDLALFAPDFPGPVTAAGTASLLPSGAWQVDTRVTGPGGIGGTVVGTATTTGQLALRIEGRAPLGLANAALDPNRIEGEAALSLTVNGPPALSSVGGTVTLAGARLALPGLGQSVQDISGPIRLAANTATLDLTAALQAGGRLALAGPVSLAAPFGADLAVTLQGLVLRDPALYQTTADGRLTVTGPLTGGARIAGLVTLGRTEIQVPSSGIGALGVLPDVVHRDAPGPVRLTLERAGLTVAGTPVNGNGGSAGPVYALDIRIEAPARIFVRGRGLDAELGGALAISGTTAQVIPSGQFSLVRGRLDLLQQRFELTEGAITLEGDFVPRLRLVVATRTRDGTDVAITVAGPATEPEVTFTSSPALPQDEVLARLLFGRDLSSISPLQAVQLAAAVGTLAGRGGGGIVNSIRENIGLDDLDITTDGDGNAALRAGRYLSENVYTDVTVGSDRTEINLNLDLTDNLTARGTVTSDGETSIGIFFERDY